MWAASTRTRDKMNECERERQPFESTTLCRPFRMCVCSGATALIKHRVCTLGRCSRDSEAVFVACNASVTYSRLSKNLHGCHQDKTHLRRLRRPPSHRRCIYLSYIDIYLMHSVGPLAVGDGWRPTPFLGCQVASGTRPLRMASWLRRWTQPMAPWRLCSMCIPGFRQPNAGANISRRKATSRSRYYRYSRQGTEHQRRIEKLLLLMMLIPSRRQAMPTMWISMVQAFACPNSFSCPAPPCAGWTDGTGALPQTSSPWNHFCFGRNRLAAGKTMAKTRASALLRVTMPPVANTSKLRQDRTCKRLLTADRADTPHLGGWRTQGIPR